MSKKKDRYWLLTIDQGDSSGEVFTCSSKEEAIDIFEELSSDAAATAFLTEVIEVKSTYLETGTIEKKKKS